MKRYAAYALALVLLPVSFALYVALELWELWHYGPSHWILSGLQWLNYKAFKSVTKWIEPNIKRGTKP